MPRLSQFYGIVVEMFYNDHPPPHFHARHGGDEALVEISTGRILRGWLPLRAKRLVGEWLEAHRAELEDAWRRAEADQPLIPIDPLP